MMKKSVSFPVPPHAIAGFCLSALAALGAGAVNGLLGTGGGILLLFVLRRHAAAQDAFASALVCILPLSALSLWLYCQNGTVNWNTLLTRDTLPYLLGAVPGGMLGAHLLDRMKVSVLQLLFAALLLFSGWRMAFS